FSHFERKTSGPFHLSFDRNRAGRTHLGSHDDLIQTLKWNVFHFVVFEERLRAEWNYLSQVCEWIRPDDFGLVHISINRELIGFHDVAHSHARTEFIGSRILHCASHHDHIYDLSGYGGDVNGVAVL